MRSNAQVVLDSIEVIWNRGELDRVSEFYTDDFVCHQGRDTIFDWPPGPEGIRKVVTAARTAWPDYHESPEIVLEQGDLVAIRQTVGGTSDGPSTFKEGAGASAPTHRKFEVVDTLFCRVEDGRLAEQWGLVDQYSMLVQLGLIEPLTATPGRS